MASLKVALLVFIGLQSCDLTLTLDVSGLQTDLDDSTNGNPCQDCTKIFELIGDLLSNADVQKKIMDDIEIVCDHLPGPVTTGQVCKEEVEKIFPLVINFITGVVKPAEVCKLLGLCSSSEMQQKMLSYFVKQALDAAVTSEDAEPTSQCTFCIFLIKSLEDLLPKERTETAVIHVVEDICHILPASYRDQCEALVAKFTKKVLDAIMSYATPQAICALMRQCKGQEATPVDPCTLATYRCKDFDTAVRCGTVFYCQKFAWKPLNMI